MRRCIGAAVVLVLTAGIVSALDDTPENRSKEADRYLAAKPPREMFEQLAQQAPTALPAQEVIKHMDFLALERAMKDRLVKVLTADELKAQADLYSSPEGKSSMKKFGIFMTEFMPTFKAEVLKAQEQATAEREKQGDQLKK